MRTIEFYVKQCAYWHAGDGKNADCLEIRDRLLTQYHNDFPDPTQRRDPKIEHRFVKDLPFPSITVLETWARDYKKHPFIRPILYPITKRFPEISIFYAKCMVLLICASLGFARLTGITLQADALEQALRGTVLPALIPVVVMWIAVGICRLLPEGWFYHPEEICLETD
jgi:hypothetical protein